MDEQDHAKLAGQLIGRFAEASPLAHELVQTARASYGDSPPTTALVLSFLQGAAATSVLFGMPRDAFVTLAELAHVLASGGLVEINQEGH